MNLYDKLSFLDLLVFSVVFLLTLCFVWLPRKGISPNKNGVVDYIVMGRQLSFPLFVSSLVASWYGGIFGVTEIAYEQGIYNFLTQGVFWYVSYILFAFFIVKKLRAYNAITLPELIGEMYGEKARKVAAVFNFFNVLPVAYALSLGLFVNLIFSLNLELSIAISTLFVALYSVNGGFRSVVYTDFIQFFSMFLAVLSLLIISVYSYGGIDFLRSNLDAHYFSLKGQSSYLQMFVWGFIALSTLIDPAFYQRCFAATNEKTAKIGILISCCIWIVFDLSTTFGAMYAKAVYPDLNPAKAYMFYALDVLPSGLKGFFLSGILATILSTMDSYFNIASTSLSYDLFPSKEDKQLLHIKISLILVAALTIILATMFDGSVKNIWKTLGAYSAGCMMVPVLAAYVKKNLLSENLFLFSTIGSALCVTGWKISGENLLGFNLDSLYVGASFSMLVILCAPILKKLSFLR